MIWIILVWAVVATKLAYGYRKESKINGEAADYLLMGCLLYLGADKTIEAYHKVLRNQPIRHGTYVLEIYRNICKELKISPTNDMRHIEKKHKIYARNYERVVRDLAKEYDS